MLDDVAAYLILAPIATTIVLVVAAIFWIAWRRRLTAATRVGLVATGRPRGTRSKT